MNLEVVRFGEKHKETIGRCGVRRVSEANLEHERFGAEVPVGLLRKISHAEHRNLLKEGFGAETENKPTGKAQRNGRTVRGSEGERSEPGGRAFWRKEYGVLFSENKPTGTLECPKGTFQCADC